MSNQNDSRFGREREIFLGAIERNPGAEREDFLKRACGDDAELRKEVETLLKIHTDDGFLEDNPRLNRNRTATGETGLPDGPGGWIGRYKILQEIGEGGFGVVYLAEQTDPVKRRVALKIIKAGMDTRQVVARFEAERQALAMMDHPNIAKVMDGGATDSGRPYFVMELVRGTPITKFCDEHNLSTQERLELFIAVCYAIQHAHQKGIIHRDIKPSNVLISMHDDKPVVKVIDFGIAKATQRELTEKTVFTQFQQFIGTPAYMSPEQAGLSGLDIDTRSDIYSLGVLLYEMLTSLTPLDPHELTTGDFAEMRRRIQEVEAPKPSTRFNSLSEVDSTTIAKHRKCDPNRLKRQLKGDLDWVILKALEKDRTRRYNTATAFADDIRRYLDSEPVTAVPPTVMYLFTKYARRHKTSLAMAASIAAVLVVSATYSAAQAIKAKRAAEAAKEAELLKSIALGSAEEERDRATQFAERLDSANEELRNAAVRAEFTAGSFFLKNKEIPKGVAHLARSLRIDPTYWPSVTRLISSLTDNGIPLDDLPFITNEGPIYDHVLDRTTGLLVTRGENYDLRVWSAWKAEQLMDIPSTGSRKMPTIGPEGRRVLYVDTNGVALVFEPFANLRSPLATLRAEAPIVQAVFSPAADQDLKAATRLADGTVQIWNGETGVALSPPMSGSSTNGGFLSFTPDGGWLAGSFADGQVGIWPVPPRNATARMLTTQPNSLLTLAPDSQTLVERAADSRSVRFWDLTSGTARSDVVHFSEPLARVPGEPGTVPLGTSHGDEFQFSQDGRRMVAVAHGTFVPYQNVILHPKLEVHLFDTTSGKLLHTISETNVTRHEENLVANLSALVLNTNRLVIRSLTTGAITMDRSWPTDAILTTAFSPAGDRILVALTDHRLIMFDTRTGDLLTDPGDPAHISNTAGGSGRAPGQTYFMRHGPRLRRLEFSLEGDVFLTHYDDGSLQLWDAFEGLPLSEPEPDREGHIDFSSDGRWMLVFRRSGGTGSTQYESSSIRVIHRDLSAARYRSLPYEGWAPVLHFSADGRYGLVGRDGLIVFNPATGEVIRRISRADTGRIGLVGSTTWLITEAWFSSSGDKIVAICHDETRRVVKVFETATGRTLHTLPTPANTNPYRVRFAGANRVVVGSWVYQNGLMPLKVWDLSTERVIAAAEPAAGPYIFDVSPDGRRIASCDSGIALIDTDTLKPVCPVLHHRNSSVGMYSIAFSPDSRRLVTGSTDGTIRVWKAETGELEAEFEHGDWPRWVGVSPNSRRVVAAGRGRYDVPSAAKVWEFENDGTRQITSSLVQQNTIQHASFSSDNRFLLTGDRGGWAQLWDLETSLPILEPIFADGAGSGGICRVGINPQMTRVFAANFSGQELLQRPLPPRNMPVPEWLAPVVEAVVGQRVNESGALESLHEPDLRQARARVAQLPQTADGGDFYAQWAHWLFADHATRTVSPFTSFTVPNELAELLQNGSLTSLRHAHHISPTNAGVFAALARETAAFQTLQESGPADPESTSAAAWYAEQAVRRAPESFETHWSQAEVLLRMNRLDAARSALASAIRLQAGNPNVLAIQSELVRRDGQTNEAHALLARALNAPAVTPSSAYLQLASVASHPDFFAEASLRNRTEQHLAGRPTGLPLQFIDLTPWYNGPVSISQTNAAKPAPGFNAPVLAIEGTPFDLRGVMEFNTLPTSVGKHKAVKGIPIGQRCALLHFLIKNGTSDLRLRVHYADGEPRTFPLPTANNEGIASWKNPRLETTINFIDLIPGLNVDTWIAAITAQTGPRPVFQTQPGPVYLRVTLGQPLELSVAMATAGPWLYQWSANDQPVDGATNATFRIPSVTAKDFTHYQVEARTAMADPASQPARSRLVWVVDSANPIVRGELKEELYLDVPDNKMQDLLSSPRFPSHPDIVRGVRRLEAPQGTLENFGRRLTGWLVPKESADYIFYLCSDDDSRLDLSSDETLDQLTEIAKLTGYIGLREWESIPAEAVSEPIHLEAGKRYFVRVLHKEGNGADHVSIAWRKAGEPPPKNGDAPIGGEFLERPAQ